MNTNHNEVFSSDPSQNLKIENEILKLKMQAEHGAQFYSEGELSPELEAEFLQHVYAFEKAWQNVKMIRIHELVGHPVFLKEQGLPDPDVQEELARLLDRLARHQIHVDVPAGKDPRDVYRFITEVLLEQEIEDLKLDGLVRHFFYNENGA